MTKRMDMDFGELLAEVVESEEGEKRWCERVAKSEKVARDRVKLRMRSHGGAKLAIEVMARDGSGVTGVGGDEEGVREVGLEESEGAVGEEEEAGVGNAEAE